MPTYDYKCTKCGVIKEYTHAMSESCNPSCKECSGKMIRYIGKPIATHFKGSGFYSNDNRRKK